LTINSQHFNRQRTSRITLTRAALA